MSAWIKDSQFPLRFVLLLVALYMSAWIKEMYTYNLPSVALCMSAWIKVAIKDYLFYECDLNEAKIQNVMKKLDVHQDIKMEFYETIMYEEFPKRNAIAVCGYIAQKLTCTTNVTLTDAYLF